MNELQITEDCNLVENGYNQKTSYKLDKCSPTLRCGVLSGFVLS